MKKRLLSAALALAMVLTLLPVSAFAADYAPTSTTAGANQNGLTFTYRSKGDKFTNNFGVIEFPDNGWYMTSSAGDYFVARSGVVTDSGVWYESITKALTYANPPSSFKLIADGTDSAITVTTGMTIDLNGHNLNSCAYTVTGNGSLTIKDSEYKAGGTRMSAGASIAVGASGAPCNGNVSLTNVAIGNGVTSYFSSTHTVTLENASVSGIMMNGTPVAPATTVSGGKVVVGGGSTVASGGIVVNQTTGSGSPITSNTSQAQTQGTVNINGYNTSVNSAITVTGNGSYVNVVDGKTTNITVDGYNTGINVTSLGRTGEIALASTTVSDADKDKTPVHTVNFTGNGTMGMIWGGGGANKATGADVININGGGTVADISLTNANVTVNGSHVTKISALHRGTLSVTGAVGKRASIDGGIVLGGNTENYGVTLTTSGSNIKLGNITRANGTSNPISITLNGTENLDENNNVYGQVPASTEANTTVVINGGTFTSQPDEKWLNNLAYVVGVYDNGNLKSYTYTNSIQKAADYEQKLGATALVRQTGNGSTEANVQLYIGDNMALNYFGTPGKQFVLPTSLGGMNNIAVWYDEAGSDSYTAGQPILLANTWDSTTNKHNSLKLNAMANGVTLAEITDITVTSHPGVRAELTSNGIRLTGTVEVDSTGTVNMTLDVLTTASKTPSTLTVVYSTTNNVALFVKPVNDPNGLTVPGNGDTLQLPGGKQYKLTSSLTKQNNDLKLRDSAQAQVTASRVSVPGYTQTQNEKLAEIMTGTGASADVKDSPAVQAALNALVGQLNGQVSSLLTTARNQKWRDKGNTTNPTTEQAGTLGLTTIWIVPCVDVQVSNYSRAGQYGTMTFNLVPSYRLIAAGSSAPTIKDKYTKDEVPIEVRGVTALGTLSGTPGDVDVNFNVESSFKMAATSTSYVHQGNTYVYDVTSTANNSVSKLSFTSKHITTGSGLGTFVINEDDALVTLAQQGATYKYDTIQAAVDDTKPQVTGQNKDKITVKGTYSGNTALTVSGKAREFDIETDTTVKEITFAKVDGFTYSKNSTNTVYNIKLDRDNTVVKPTEKPIPISTVSVTGGSVSLSASRADEGDTITVTLVPATGYVAGGITVRTDTGANVSYTATGTNTYRFVVPTGAKSITVTPSFTRTNTGVLITVSGNTYGTATTTAGTNRVAVGSTVSVTVSPSSGYRTMGLYVTSDTGVSATAYRTGVNTFTFAVPSATSSVVVTPRFDRNNGTIFEDVWSTDYFSNAVAWAVGRSITDGTDTYHFSPGQSCNRVQMVTFLWRAAGRPSTAGMANPFYDVSPSMGNDFYNAILWANAKGITNGDGSATRFNPYKTVNRAEAVTFLWRYAGKPAASTRSGFYDVPTNEFYAQAVTWAVSQGITNGDGSTTIFNPYGACLRAQIVTFLYRQATGTRA